MTKKEIEQRDRAAAKKRAALRKAAEPLVKYLNDHHHHPHTTAIVTPTSVEVLEGVIVIPKIYDFIKD